MDEELNRIGILLKWFAMLSFRFEAMSFRFEALTFWVLSKEE